MRKEEYLMINIHGYVKIKSLERALYERYGGDSSGVVFMLPSSSSKDALRAFLAGGGYFGRGPRIWDWSAMYKNLTERDELRRQIDPPDHRLILRCLRDKFIREKEELALSVPEGARKAGFIGVLSDAVRELLLEATPPDMLHEAAARDGAISPRGILYEIYRDYLIYLDDHRLADNSQLPWLLSKMNSEDIKNKLSGDSLCWIGFLSMTGAQLALVQRFREAGIDMDFFAPQTGLADFHDLPEQLGASVHIIDSADVSSELRNLTKTFSAPDIYWQYEGIAREIALASNGEGNLAPVISADMDETLSDVGIYLPSDAISLMEAALTKYGVPHQTRAETPVAETPMFKIARSAWEAYRLGWPYRKTWRILRGYEKRGLSLPFRLPTINPSFAGRAADIAAPEGMSAWRRILGKGGLAEDTESLSLLEELDKFCAFLNEEGGHTGAELLAALLSLWGEERDLLVSRDAGDDTSLDAAVRESVSARGETEQKLRLLEELSPPLGEAGDIRFRDGDAMVFLSDWARETMTVLPARLGNVVCLYDAPPPVLVSHKLWIITDVSPPRFPGPQYAGQLISGELRDEINKAKPKGADEFAVHLPTMSETREQKEALFLRMIAVAETVTILVRSAKDSSGREQSVSPFVLSLYGRARGGDENSYEDDIRFDAKELLDGEQAGRGAFPRAGRVNPAGAAVRRPPPLVVSLSAVDRFADCPFAFWCENIARLERPRGDTGVFGALRAGDVMHKMWQILWEDYLKNNGSVSFSGLLAQKWEDMLTSLAKKYPELNDARALPSVIDLRGRMERGAAAQDNVELGAARNGLVRARTEFEYVLPDYESARVIFRGRVDRVDVWNEGAVLIDYKRGESGKYKNSLQLASYAAVLRASGDSAYKKLIGFGYIGHGDGKITGWWADDNARDAYFAAKSEKTVTMEEKTAEALALMENINDSAGRGTFGANYESDSCGRCSWGTICRRHENRGVSETNEDGGGGADFAGENDE
ncbi:hypothetical protein FACS1894167_12720 [Synergistales bacterium]|nr:hypothetical protein FACS1894167_12720 [Synergistales bacterium]